MIGCGFGIGGPNADIDEGNARSVGAFKVVGRHLRLLRWRGQRAIGCCDFGIAGRDETGVSAVRLGQHATGIGFEFGDIELVVGEQNMGLKMVRVGRCIMVEARQRIIHPRGGEGG